MVLVDRSPCLLAGSLADNLRLGRKQAWEWGSEESLHCKLTRNKLCSEDASVKCANALEDLMKATALACGVSPRLLQDLNATVLGPGLDFLTTRDALGICMARAFLAHPDILFLDDLGDFLGPEYVEARLLPLLCQYASGGLKAVLLAGGHTEVAKSLPDPHQPPIVIWTSLVLPKRAASRVTLLLQLDGEGGLTVEEPGCIIEPIIGSPEVSE